MKFRTGLMVGFAAGYVLGAKAGKQRYEQIRKAANAVMGTPPMQKLVEESRQLAEQSTTKVRTVASEQLQSVSDHVRDIANEKLGNSPA